MYMRSKVFNLCKSMLLLFLISVFLNFICTLEVHATPNQGDNSKLILIDPGHGGRDSGAVSRNGVLEKHINLSISLKVKEKLECLGYQVMMTREEDKDFYGQNSDINMMKRQDLNIRCNIKRDSNCDLFISIHQNFFKQRSCQGSQI